ncbi:hypothetical protein [Brenneria uluponensis]|uniref:hypothetical protein n=1 Tax=Brenneria uluponensis TaxID=3057057 RepID=UPI0028EA3BFC|nr:hypothetical protein [Brenneria ulupoensis]
MDYFKNIKFYLKAIICITPIIGGFYIAANGFIHNNYLGGLSGLLAGLGISWGLIISFLWGKIRLNVSSSFFLLCTVLGVFGIFSTHKALDPKYQQIRLELYSAFMESPLYCNDTHGLMLEGVKHCSTEAILDIADLNYQLSKAIHLDPITSLIDGIYSTGKEENIDKCLVDYVAARKQCPSAFIIVEKEFPELKEKR